MKLLKAIAFGLSGVALMSAVSTASAAVVLTENFTYSNGSLVGAAGSPWASHSGTLGQVDVSSNAVNLTFADSEDVNATLAGQPYTTGTLYAGFDLNMSVLPSATGTYLAHFKDTGTTNFRGRVFVNTTGAAANKYRVGVTSNNGTAVFFATDLGLGEVHRLVVALNTGTGQATLYLDAATETGGLAATDALPTPVGITSFALRQASGMGTSTLDNLRVATTFAETAVPEPTAAALLAAGAIGLLARRRQSR